MRTVEVCVIDKTLPPSGRSRFLEIVLQVKYFGYIDDVPVLMMPTIVPVEQDRLEIDDDLDFPNRTR